MRSVCADFQIGLRFLHPQAGWKGATTPDDAKFSASRGHDRSRSRAVRFCCAGELDGPKSRNGDRPYRRGMSHPEAIAILHRYAGTQFDPQVVKAFAALASHDQAAEIEYREAVSQ